MMGTQRDSCRNLIQSGAQALYVALMDSLTGTTTALTPVNCHAPGVRAKP
jgi:hypothetical protein